MPKKTTQRFERWVLEGSNGQILLGPCTLVDAVKALQHHQELVHSIYSASAPMPSHQAKACADSRLGYIIRKVIVTVEETYEI